MWATPKTFSPSFTWGPRTICSVCSFFPLRGAICKIQKNMIKCISHIICRIWYCENFTKGLSVVCINCSRAMNGYCGSNKNPRFTYCNCTWICYNSLYSTLKSLYNYMFSCFMPKTDVLAECIWSLQFRLHQITCIVTAWSYKRPKYINSNVE